MLKVIPSSQFKKDFKKYAKDQKIVDRFTEVIDILISGQALPDKYKDHKLFGQFSDCRECHIFPDTLMIYKVHNDKLELLLLRMGSHSDVF